MRRLIVSLTLVSLSVLPVAAHADEGDGGNGSGDGCYHGGCNTHHRHDGDTCISPCSITIIVPPNNTTTTTMKESHVPA